MNQDYFGRFLGFDGSENYRSMETMAFTIVLYSDAFQGKAPESSSISVCSNMLPEDKRPSHTAKYRIGGRWLAIV
ncbi:MAG: hypothetical protein AAF546_06485 [Verrucomicrobiota bacterium]